MHDRAHSPERRTSFGRFVFNHERLELIRDHQRMELPAASLSLLSALLDRAGQTVPHHELASSTGASSGTAASEATRSAMRQLRQALRDPADYPMFVETVRGVGYRFIAPVSLAGPVFAQSAPTFEPTASPHSSNDLPNVASIGTANRPIDRLPQRNLLQWLADDASSVDFAIVWTIATVPFSTMSDGPGLMALMLVPPILRLAQRAMVFRRLLQDGVSPNDIRHAFEWANDGDPKPARPAGWRNLLATVRRISGWMLIAATITLLFWMELRPWNFSKNAQHVFSGFVQSYIVFGKLTIGIFLVDAALRPRPVWQGFRRHARRGWRALLSGFLPSGKSPDDFGMDAYRLAADREVELMLGAATAE